MPEILALKCRADGFALGARRGNKMTSATGIACSDVDGELIEHFNDISCAIHKPVDTSTTSSKPTFRHQITCC